MEQQQLIIIVYLQEDIILVADMRIICLKLMHMILREQKKILLHYP
uniref:Uncharacterized protein n=1 Tax=Myoviridae sp. ctjhW4 TaxID=2825162 RepID=A0A8S5PRG8_9CAUD|nr:MAG TPA: hypothetical protein [Myoviridae sp. ctjhW4]